MTDSVPSSSTAPATVEKTIRLWPGVLAIIAMWGTIIVPRKLDLDSMAALMAMMWAPMIGSALVLIWWLLLSRVRWSQRLLVLAMFLLTGAGAIAIYDPSVRMLGLMFQVLPAVVTAWVVYLVVTTWMNWPVRRIGLLFVLAATWGYFALYRLDGVDGSFNAEMTLRWKESAEQQFERERASASKDKLAPTESGAKALTVDAADWPGFRGVDRDARRPGVSILTNWNKFPPKLLWKHRVGPGWSSFAVVGDSVFTQEQRGEEEAVVCYDANSGKETWIHLDHARFSEFIAGPGPRATPTFFEGRLYTLGAKGKLLCLDARTGTPVWSRDIVADSRAKVPDWGFSASPTVAHGIVSVYAGGYDPKAPENKDVPDDKIVLGYQIESGKPAWTAKTGTVSYCSTHPARFGNVDQLLVTTGDGVTAFSPAKGEVLWNHEWKMESGMARVTQPTVLSNGDVLLGTGFGMGLRRIHVEQVDGKWTTKELWTTRAIKPYFNDLVVHKDHVYGFDNAFFTCVTLDGGKAKWRTRGYGNGQVLLLPDQDLLLILSETGDAALVEASPAEHKQLGKFKAIEGKTWNHPVVARDKLFVRNGEEAACFQLALVK